MQYRVNNPAHEGEEGFLLLAVVVMVFLVLLALGVAAPTVARSLRREREVEAIHRGNEYVRAIQLYYRKFGRYPGNMDQLEKSTNIRFLRRKYEDPMTGKANWRLIHAGEAKTTVKGFFGQPLAGVPGSAGGLGAAASMVSAGQGGASTVSGTSATGTTSGLSSGFSSSSSGSTSSFGSSGAGPSSGFGSGTSGSSSTSGTTVDSTSSSSSTGGIGSQSATSFTGGGAPIVGVGSSKTGTSITVLNEQTTYETWEFLYDPRIEQLKAKAALLGGASTAGSSSSGTGSSTSGFGSSGSSTSGFGSSSSFGSSSGSSGTSSGFGGSTSSSNPQ